MKNTKAKKIINRKSFVPKCGKYARILAVVKDGNMLDDDKLITQAGGVKDDDEILIEIKILTKEFGQFKDVVLCRPQDLEFFALEF